MTTELLKQYITEVMNDLDQNIVRKDPEGTGQLVIRKLVTFKKPASRFSPGEDVDAELDGKGNAVIDDLEMWKPDFEKSRRKARQASKTSHKKVHKLA
jgi:hypothetical protein